MSVKIGEVIESIIQDRSRGNPAIAEMTRAKLILKGINSDKYDLRCSDEPEILEKLIGFRDTIEYGDFDDDTSPFITAYSQKEDPGQAVLDIQDQMGQSNIKVLIYFAAPIYDQEKLSRLMKIGFESSIVFGCSSAGEKANDKLMTNSIVALGLTSKIVADAKVELVENLNKNLDINPAFNSFSGYFNESTYDMDFDRYVGIVLIDGLSKKEEKVIDEIGNLTNIRFVGGSAGDYLKFEQTLVYANGKCYDDSAVIALLKLHENVGFRVINTQSFKSTDLMLYANKVDKDARQVIEFNYKPASKAYAEALGQPIDQIKDYFFSHPVGLVIDEDNILVRSPRFSIDSSKMEFSANILEGMKVYILENDDIIRETKRVIEDLKEELDNKLVGIISFDCIYRRLEIDEKEIGEEYGDIFKGFPSIGLCSYGEINIGFMNQTCTMLILEYKDFEENIVNQDLVENDEQHLINVEYKELQTRIKELEQELDKATEELKIFNRLLENEIKERSKKEEYIGYISYHDQLTGLYNRRYFEEVIVDIDIEKNLPISIIVGDVNNLKVINDTLGHAKGDELLKVTAQVIESACRKEDIIARIGGDEFVVLLPDTPNTSAEKVVKRIKSLAEIKRVCGYPVSISFGYATKESSGEDMEEKFSDAEKQMYKNKNQQKQGS